MQEALDVLEAAIDYVASSDLPSAHYDDADEYLAWIRNDRARALWALGRFDQATAEQRASYNASKDDEVSQAINLAELYVQTGHPEEAVELLEAIKGKDASPYGYMAAEAVRACAYQALGDERLAGSLEYLKAHRTDGLNALRTALLCVGDDDSLAHLLVDQIYDPETRLQMLIDLQTYLPKLETEHQAKLTARFYRVRSRPDVAAAIAQFGRVLSWHTTAEL